MHEVLLQEVRSVVHAVVSVVHAVVSVVHAVVSANTHGTLSPLKFLSVCHCFAILHMCRLWYCLAC